MKRQRTPLQRQVGHRLFQFVHGRLSEGLGASVTDIEQFLEAGRVLPADYNAVYAAAAAEAYYRQGDPLVYPDEEQTNAYVMLARNGRAAIIAAQTELWHRLVDEEQERWSLANRLAQSHQLRQRLSSLSRHLSLSYKS